MKERKNRIIIHVDMDAFYAAAEQLDHVEYRNRPVVVGADPCGGKGRGVVSAASYEARKYGIHSAQPISQAYRLCPDAVFLRPRFKRYTKLSNQVMKILYDFSPVIEQISIDEAFLDCTGTEALLGTPEELALHIKERIQGETGLTASVGVASNKSIAKIASELCKPDGLKVVPSGNEKEFLSELSLQYLWGAGKKTIEKLKGMGFGNIGDVAKCSPVDLSKRLGKYGFSLWHLANGMDERPVISSHLRKSISEETTFKRDVDDNSYIESVFFKISDRLTRKMRTLGIKGRTITMKIRLQGFETFTRSRTMEHPVSDMKTVRSVALNLYRSFNREGKKVRLIGIALSNFETNDKQLELFSDERFKDRKEESDKLFDMMRSLYGDKVTRGAFLPQRSDNGYPHLK